MGKLRVYCLKTLNKPSIYPLGNTPSAPSATIITGDFNLHSPMWSPDQHPSSPFADKLIEWMKARSFHLLNNPGEITFQRADQASVLDLTWINRKAFDQDLVQEWSIRPNLNIRSDHFPTVWFVPLTHSPPILGPDPPAFHFTNKKASDWIDALTQEAKPVFTDSLLQSKNVTEEQLDHVIEIFHGALISASRQTMKAKMNKPRANPWFTHKVQVAIARTQAAHRLVCLAHHGQPVQSQDVELQYRVQRWKLKRVVAKAKHDWALHFAETIKSNKVWSLNSWYKGVQRYSIPHLEAPDGTKLTAPESKCQLIHQTFFPVPPHVHVDDFDFNQTRANTRPFQDVTHEEVE